MHRGTKQAQDGTKYTSKENNTRNKQRHAHSLKGGQNNANKRRRKYGTNTETQASNTKSQHHKPQRAKCQGVKNTIESQKEQKGKKCFLRLFHPTQTSLSAKKLRRNVMIIINNNAKQGTTIDIRELTHLCVYDKKGNYSLKSDFYCEVKDNGDIIVETTLSAPQEIKRRIEKFLYSTLENCKKIIFKHQEKARKLNKLLNESLIKDARYYVCEDLQGGSFGMGRDFTIDQWRMQAYEWCFMDENYEVMKIIKDTPDNEVLDWIAEYWALRFKKVRKDKKHLSAGSNDFTEYITPDTYFENVYYDETEEKKNENN